MPDQGTFQFTVDSVIMTTAQAVFHAFTEAAELSTWFTTDAKIDPHVGGTYSNADGDQGAFLEIEVPSRLVFTWENPEHCPCTLVIIGISEESVNGLSGCADNGLAGKNDRLADQGEVICPIIVSITHSRLRSKTDMNRMKVGWKWALISLKSYLETGKPVRYEEWMEEQNRILRSSQ